MLSLRACMCVCMHVCVVTFLNQALYGIYDIFTKFAENVYGCENMSLKNFVLILKYNMAAIAECSKIIDMFLNFKYCS